MERLLGTKLQFRRAEGAQVNIVEAVGIEHPYRGARTPDTGMLAIASGRRGGVLVNAHHGAARKQMVAACEEYGMPALLERARQHAHCREVWLHARLRRVE